MTSPRFARFLAQIRHGYDEAIIDLPPLACVDSRLTAPAVQRDRILVDPSGRTDSRAAPERSPGNSRRDGTPKEPGRGPERASEREAPVLQGGAARALPGEAVSFLLKRWIHGARQPDAVFGHYVLGSRVRLFLAEQAARGRPLPLRRLSSAARLDHARWYWRPAVRSRIQLPLYLADLYEPTDAFPEARWLVAAGAGGLFVTLLWQRIGRGISGELPAASLLSLLLVVMLREIALTRPRRAMVLGSGETARAVGSIRESLVDCTIGGLPAGHGADTTGADTAPRPSRPR